MFLLFYTKDIFTYPVTTLGYFILSHAASIPEGEIVQSLFILQYVIDNSGLMTKILGGAESRSNYAVRRSH